MNTENQELVKQDNSLMGRLGPVEIGARGVKLATMDDVFRFAKAVSMSQLCPPGFSETDCFVIIQNGLEVGMSPMAALANTYVVNNRATIFGDMPLALVRQSGLMENYKQEYTGKQYDDDFCCTITTKRRGTSDPIVTTYSVADAREAQLWEKAKSPWLTAKKRMLLYRARGFNLRDNFGDVLKGCSIAELNDDFDGDLNQAGITHARPIAGKVVEPNFQDRQPPTGLRRVVSPDRVEQLLNEQSADRQQAEPVKRGPGRPRKEESPNRDRRPGDAFPTAAATMPQDAPAAEPETKPAAPPQPPPQPPTAPPAAPVTPGPVNESKVHAAVRQRLHNENIRHDRFLIRMLGFGFASCDRDDILTGKFKLENMAEEDLDMALRNWDQVVNIDDV